MTTVEPNEPTVRPQPGGVEKRLFAAFEHAESLLIAMVALVLIGLAFLALLDTVRRVVGPLLQADPDYTHAVTAGIDAAFLVIILLELYHTTLSRGPISQQLQEFLTIGVTATVRHGLALTAGTSNARELAIDLAINALGVVILVSALWLVRQQLPTHRGRPGAEPAAATRP